MLTSIDMVIWFAGFCTIMAILGFALYKALDLFMKLVLTYVVEDCKLYKIVEKMANEIYVWEDETD